MRGVHGGGGVRRVLVHEEQDGGRGVFGGGAGVSAGADAHPHVQVPVLAGDHFVGGI